MSQTDCDDFTFVPTSPRSGSADDSTQSLRAWTIPRLTAELRRRGIPYPATARKAELFRLLFPNPPATPPEPQASLESISSAISQLHDIVATLTTSITDVQSRVGALETRPATPPATPTATLVAIPPATSGMPVATTPIFPAHFIPAGVRKDILDGKDVNLASLLISVHDVAENKSYSWGDVSVVLKAKDPRLNRKLSITEFVLAFGLFRDVVCSANPDRREELDLYLHALVDLGHKYGGYSFYEYHRSFSAKAAARLAQFQLPTNWSAMDTELFCRHFAGLRSPLCSTCQSASHTANWCSETSGRRPPTLPSTSYAPQNPLPAIQSSQPDKLGRPVRTLGGTAICNNFNTKGCFFAQCRLLHICLLCQKAHPKTTCTLKQPGPS